MNKLSFCMAGRSVTIFVLIASVMVLSGCEPLRKKFVRQKKTVEKDVSADAVFDPIEYPHVSQSPEETYTHFLTMWRIWSGELANNISEGANDKRLQFHLEQMRAQLNGMGAMLPDSGVSAVASVSRDLEDLAGEIAKPRLSRNNTLILSRIRGLDRRVRNELALSSVGPLKNAP